MFRTAVHAARHMNDSQLANALDPGLKSDVELVGIRVEPRPTEQSRFSKRLQAKVEGET